MKAKRHQVTVIGRYDATDEQYQMGMDIGRMLAELNITAITGGRGGLMEAVARGCTEAGGLSVGILPGEQFEESNEYNSVVIPSGIGYARNSMNVLAADVVIAVGGAAGTLSEMAFAWSYKRPVIALLGSGGWAEELAGKHIDHRWEQEIIPATDVAEIRKELVKLLGIDS
ncbi:MAG: TIGR00725 family protein [Flavobacteriales bacterium]|nr:TIGR00725 family protein [Flavobacteriales bacterium]